MEHLSPPLQPSSALPLTRGGQTTVSPNGFGRGIGAKKLVLPAELLRELVLCIVPPRHCCTMLSTGSAVLDSYLCAVARKTILRVCKVK